ncbi:MAG: COG2426 family protein [Candidatus Hydrothermarchaeaceae archaeon]
MVAESALVEALQGLPPSMVVLFISMTPFSELRGGIPVAMGVYGMEASEAYLLGVLGNLIPVLPLLLLLEPVEKRLRNIYTFDVFFDWLFARTRMRMESSYEKYGALALMLFVAIPLPVTGAWTGCAAAYVFGIKFRHSLPAVLGGVLLAGAIVTTAYLGGSTAYNLV